MGVLCFYKEIAITKINNIIKVFQILIYYRGGQAGNKKNSKVNKARTVQSALARMSNMFMGTLTVKGPKASQAFGKLMNLFHLN